MASGRFLLTCVWIRGSTFELEGICIFVNGIVHIKVHSRIEHDTELGIFVGSQIDLKRQKPALEAENTRRLNDTVDGSAHKVDRVVFFDALWILRILVSEDSDIRKCLTCPRG